MTLDDKTLKYIEHYKAIKEKKKAEMANEPYKVGYKKPPVSSQFKKGQSGNPKGRKKKPIPETIYHALCNELCQMVTIDNPTGSKEKLHIFELLVKSIIQDAIKKDGISRKFIMENLLKSSIMETVKMLIEKQNPKEEEFTPEERRLLLQDLHQRLFELTKDNP